MKPVITERVRVYYAQLIDPSQARQAQMSDDFIRGAIQSLKWAITYPDEELKAYRAAELEEEAAVKEMAEVIPLFGGGRPDSGNGDTHGRGSEGGGS